jgi:hypothetical protein
LLGQLVKSGVLLEGTAIFLGSFISLLFDFCLLVLILSDFKFVLSSFLHFPRVLHCSSAGLWNDLIIRPKNFKDREVLSFEYICKAVFLLNGLEGQDAIDAGKLLFVMVVADCDLCNDVFLFGLFNLSGLAFG